MDVRRLDLLRELSERGSITAVAFATHRTPSAVSQQLKKLEREVGVPLTERRPWADADQTPESRWPAASGDVAVALAKAGALWDEFRNRPSGEVSLVTFPTAGQMLLPGTLAALPDGLVLRCTDLDPEQADFPALTADHDIVLAHAMPGQQSWGGRGLRSFRS